MFKYVLVLLIAYNAQAIYLSPRMMSKMGSFTCDTTYITIKLLFQSDTTNVNFITFLVNADYSCSDSSFIISPELSVIGIQSFAGTLSKNTSISLCYAFINTDYNYGTNLYYRMDVECGNDLLPAPIINMNNYSISLIVSIVFNCLLGLALILMIFYHLWKKYKRNDESSANTIAIEPIKIDL